MQMMPVGVGSRKIPLASMVSLVMVALVREGDDKGYTKGNPYLAVVYSGPYLKLRMFVKVEMEQMKVDMSMEACGDHRMVSLGSSSPSPSLGLRK